MYVVNTTTVSDLRAKVIIPTKSDPLFCKDYCWANKFCSQWKEWVAEHGKKKGISI